MPGELLCSIRKTRLRSSSLDTGWLLCSIKVRDRMRSAEAGWPSAVPGEWRHQSAAIDLEFTCSFALMSGGNQNGNDMVTVICLSLRRQLARRLQSRRVVNADVYTSGNGTRFCPAAMPGRALVAIRISEAGRKFDYGVVLSAPWPGLFQHPAAIGGPDKPGHDEWGDAMVRGHPGV